MYVRRTLYTVQYYTLFLDFFILFVIMHYFDIAHHFVGKGEGMIRGGGAIVGGWRSL